MQYLSGVPQYSSDLKWILVFLEVWAGVLWTDTMSVCSASIKETLQLFAGGCMSDAYFPLNTGVKSLQSSTLNARMPLTESLNQGVFFNASIAM